MVGYVYITTNLINNKQYIGQHRSSTFSRSYIGSGKLLRKAIKKYGKENFACNILQRCETFKELDEAEKYWIAYFNADLSDNFYNLASGGYGKEGLRGKNNGRFGKPVSEETRQKISVRNKGKKRTPEQIEQNRICHTGLKYNMSEEVRERKSDHMKGKNNPMYGNHNTRYRMTEEIKQKISKTKKENWSLEAHYNYNKIAYTDPSTLETHYFIEGEQHKGWIKGNIKLSKKVNNKGENNPRARKLLAIETNEIFWGIKEVAIKFQTSRNTIVKYIGKFNPNIGLTLIDYNVDSSKFLLKEGD